MTVRFDCGPGDRDTLLAIVERAESLRVMQGTGVTLLMDLEAVHSNGCPLDFAKLRSFPRFDFVHDITGIQRHIDRETGKLGNCFLPRCVKPEVANA